MRLSGLVAALVLTLSGCSSQSSQDAGAPVDAGGSDAGADAGRVTVVFSDDGKLALEVSEASGVVPGTISVRRRTTAELAGRPGTLIAYELSPDGTRFAAPITARFRGTLEDFGFHATDGGEVEGPYALPGLEQSDGGLEPMGSPRLVLDFIDGGAELSGTLTHFTDAVVAQPDHERFAGRLAFGFMGISQLPIANSVGPANAPAAPMVNLRFWYARQVGLDLPPPEVTATQTVPPPARYGFGLNSGIPIALNASRHVRSDVVPPFPETSVTPRPVLADPGTTTSFRLDLGIRLDPEVHFGFVGVPELSVQATVALGLRFQGCTGTRTEPEAAQLGQVVSLALLHGVPLDMACARARFGVMAGPTMHSTGLRTEGALDPTTSTLATSVQDTPWRIFATTVSALYYFSALPCGPGDYGHTLCPSPATLPPAGDFVIVAGVMQADVPLADPTNRRVYAFVFDSDGDSSNNYRAPANYPKDFYDDTDRWYEATYAPGTGWAFTAKTARDGVISVTPTAARLVISGNSLMLVAPSSEFDVPKPTWRFTAFRHTGDYGINPPYDWNGDVEPPVGMPLATVP